MEEHQPEAFSNRIINPLRKSRALGGKVLDAVSTRRHVQASVEMIERGRLAQQRTITRLIAQELHHQIKSESHEAIEETLLMLRSNLRALPGESLITLGLDEEAVDSIEPYFHSEPQD